MFYAALMLMTTAGWLEDVGPAAADAASLGPEAVHTRYFTVANLPLKDRADYRAGGDFWVNSLSTESKLRPMRRVTNTLVAINLLHYGPQWAKVFDKLQDEDPYFHVRLDVHAGATTDFWFTKANAVAQGYGTQAGFYPATVQGAGRVTAIAPWTKDVTLLIALTQSPCPILRLDWFLSRIAIQDDRKVGYYDFLGVKDRKEFEALAGLDIKLAEKVQKEAAGIVRKSGVSRLPRQIFRYQSVTGDYWVTHDVLDDSRDARNALRNLFGAFKHQAEEHYLRLPNGTFAFFLSDQNGVRTDTAPDKIGPDTTTKSRDGRIHIGLSCVRCHVEGIRPISNWAEENYEGDSPFSSVDYEFQLRVERVYLDDLSRYVKKDSTEFAERLKATNGLTIAANATMVSKIWHDYVDKEVTAEDGAAEFGVTLEVYQKRLRDYFAKHPPADPVVNSHVKAKPIRMNLADWEEAFPILAQAVLLNK